MYEHEYSDPEAGQAEQKLVSSPEPTTLQKPDHLISLATSGMLVSVNVSIWSATKQDRLISDEITTAKKAVHAAGKYTKNLLADNPKHKSLLNYRQTIYNWLKRRTYDWSGTQQYLPSVDMPKFMAEYHDHEKAFTDIVDSFEAEYDSIVSDMAFKQGDMFNRNDYPSKEQVRSKFSIELFVNNVPMNDFRCAIAEDIADDLFATYQRQSEKILRNILNEQAERFIDVMHSISHCCGYDEIGKEADGEQKLKKRKIYDTTILKAKDMCSSFKEFNLDNNPELEAARKQLESALSGVDAEALRDSDAVRDSVKREVDDILGKFGAFECVQKEFAMEVHEDVNE